MKGFEKRLAAPTALVFMALMLLGESAWGEKIETVNRALSPASGLGRTMGMPAQASVGLSALPLAAQPAVSGALGSETPGYQAENVSGGAEARNPRQQLASYFTATGVEVSRGGSSWQLSLRAFGHGTALTPAGEVQPRASSNRVEYQRGSLTEWYSNGPVGLEQGFTLERPPAGIGSGPLTIALALSGDLTAGVNQDRSGLTLTAKGQPLLQYTGLCAYDATGKELRAWLEIGGQQLLVKVDDAQARYPVVVDPFLQAAELTPSNAASNDYFGYSVAINGQTIVVGAPTATVGSTSYQGAAYVFVAPKTGWVNATQTAELTSSDGATDDWFGWSVGVSSSTVVVGAFGHHVYQGAAYVFSEPTGGWVNGTQTAELTTSNGKSYDYFGYNLAISNSTVVIGAPNHSVNGGIAGVAYVYVRPGTGWANTSKAKAQLESSDETANDYFASTVAISGTTIVIGAPFASSDLGAVYIYVEPQTGWASTTAYTAKLTASNGVEYDDLGYSVSIGGTGATTVAAGAPGVNGETGAVYVFVKPSGGWVSMTQTAELTASDGSGGDNFGYAVATSGGYVIAGAPNAVINSNDLEGAAYVYAMPTGGWVNTSTFTAKLTASDGAANAHFGHAVQVTVQFSVVGAYEATVNSVNSGATYVFKN